MAKNPVMPIPSNAIEAGSGMVVEVAVTPAVIVPLAPPDTPVKFAPARLTPGSLPVNVKSISPAFTLVKLMVTTSPETELVIPVTVVVGRIVIGEDAALE